MNILDASLQYSTNGWVVHPLTGPKSGGKSAGKRPIIKKWQYMAQPHNEQQLTQWFENTSYNLGLVCGEASDIIVIDIDHDLFKHEMFDGIDVETLRAQRTTGRGHIFFKYTDKVKSQKHHDLGFEILSNGNNAVLTPSIHVSGDVYSWINPDAEVAEFPLELIDRIDNLVTQKKHVASLVGKCRKCFRDLWSNKPDVHGADGREMMLAFCTELKANGAKLDDVLFVAKMMYGKDFDVNRTEIEFRNADENKTWKCNTLSAQLPKYINCADCTGNKKDTVKQAVQQTKIPNMMDVAASIHDNSPYIYDNARCFWLWLDNYYCRVDETDIVGAVLEQTGNISYLKRSLKGEILDAIRITGRRTVILPLPGKWIQFMNMTIDVKNGNEFQSEPSHFYTSPIPHNISSSTDTPNIDQLFTDWVGEDRKQILYEICAYCMLPSYPIHRMFWFLGKGRNGKGRFMALVNKLIGSQNTTSTDLERLSDSRFESSKLFKKIVAFVGETDHNILKRTNLLKSLTGDDPISAEFKNKEPFDFYNTAKILIATNSIPGIEDKTDGWYSRNIIIDFPNQFSEGKDIIGVIEEWELENMCRKCIDILKELLINGEFYGEGSIEDKRDRYEESSNPVKMFLDLYCEDDNNNFIPMFVFRDAFIPFLEERGYRKMSNKEITMRLKSEGYTIENKRMGNKVWKSLLNINISGILKGSIDRSVTDNCLNNDSDVTNCNDSSKHQEHTCYTCNTGSHSEKHIEGLSEIPVTSVTSVTELSQRDLMKFLFDSIQVFQVDGLTKIETVANHSIKHNIPFHRFRDAIKHMKTTGKIMEPKEGYYKCT